MRCICNALIFCLVMFFVACTKVKPVKLDFAEQDVMNPDVSWAVIKTSVAFYMQKPEYDNNDRSLCGRKYDVKKVKGKIEFADSTWYFFDEGWLESSDIDVYDTKLKAEAASGKLMTKDLN